jgi:hypothetical protein
MGPPGGCFAATAAAARQRQLLQVQVLLQAWLPLLTACLQLLLLLLVARTACLKQLLHAVVAEQHGLSPLLLPLPPSPLPRLLFVCSGQQGQATVPAPPAGLGSPRLS